MTDFVRNQWYVAAYSEEVGEPLLGRTILGEPIVLYRTQDGIAVALGDRVTAVAVASMPGPLDEVPGGWDALDRRQRPAAEVAREDPARAARGVVRYTQRWLDDPTTFLGGGTPDDRALLADPATVTCCEPT